MGLFNLNTEKAQQVSDRQETIRGLKPVGNYLVQAVKPHLFLEVEEGRIPSISFEQKILGFMGKSSTEFVTKSDGMPVYANARLFFACYISEKGLFMLEAIRAAMGADELKGAELAAKLNSFETEAKLAAWIKTWLDVSENYVVYVNHDLDSEVPSERVFFARNGK